MQVHINHSRQRSGPAFRRGCRTYRALGRSVSVVVIRLHTSVGPQIPEAETDRLERRQGHGIILRQCFQKKPLVIVQLESLQSAHIRVDEPEPCRSFPCIDCTLQTLVDRPSGGEEKFTNPIRRQGEDYFPTIVATGNLIGIPYMSISNRISSIANRCSRVVGWD